MYKVIHFFRDLKDRNHAYHVGDSFPYNGMDVSEDRLLELSTDANRRHEPLIEKVEEEPKEPEEPVEGFMNPPEPETAPEKKEDAPKPKKKRGRPRNDAQWTLPRDKELFWQSIAEILRNNWNPGWAD